MQGNRMLGVGAVMALLGVLAGAFGAHALKGMMTPDHRAVYETGVLYHLVHALALVAISPSKLASRAITWFFVAGIILFSGSLYLLAVTGAGWWGAVTPFGGLSFLAGWAVLAWTAFRLPKAELDDR